MKNTIRTVLFILIIIGVSAWAWKNFASTKQETSTQVAAITMPDHAIVVTYFTSDQRCKTCFKIEKQTRKAIEEGFPNELDSQEVIFQTINFDRPEHKHFIDKYKLSFKTIVISERQDGKEESWSKYDKVWELVNDPDDFTTYLHEGVTHYLKKGKEQPTQSKNDA